GRTFAGGVPRDGGVAPVGLRAVRRRRRPGRPPAGAGPGGARLRPGSGPGRVRPEARRPRGAAGGRGAGARPGAGPCAARGDRRAVGLRGDAAGVAADRGGRARPSFAGPVPLSAREPLVARRLEPAELDASIRGDRPLGAGNPPPPLPAPARSLLLVRL